MRALSKSKLLAYRQCHKRLWLEVRHPELREDSMATETTFQVGHQIGELARRLYDPKGKGILINLKHGDLASAFLQTAEAIRTATPIFEAGLSAGGALAFADVLLPVKRRGKLAWRMIEVKSSTGVKDYYRDDIAIQAFVAKQSGLELASVSVAHIDRTFIYGGTDDYDGILAEDDLTKEASGRENEVTKWIAEAHSIVANEVEPPILTGRHCNDPYECGFRSHCQGREPQAKYPATLLPRVHVYARFSEAS
jgi:CRISPR/Cas system-associated exonuclease Cas4 (RecB family)